MSSAFDFFKCVKKKSIKSGKVKVALNVRLLVDSVSIHFGKSSSIQCNMDFCSNFFFTFCLRSHSISFYHSFRFTFLLFLPFLSFHIPSLLTIPPAFYSSCLSDFSSLPHLATAFFSNFISFHLVSPQFPSFHISFTNFIYFFTNFIYHFSHFFKYFKFPWTSVSNSIATNEVKHQKSFN